jgi:hypothetical protein
MAADQPGDPGVSGRENGGHEATGDAAETDDGVTRFFLRGLGVQGRSETSCQAQRAQFGKFSSVKCHSYLGGINGQFKFDFLACFSEDNLEIRVSPSNPPYRVVPAPGGKKQDGGSAAGMLS